MIRRPPRSTRTDTLFPYTTLFRSGWATLAPPADVRTEYETIPGRAGPIAIKKYFPAKLNPDCPRVLFLHGGGWIHGGLETLDYLCAAVSQQAQCLLVRSEERRVGKEWVSKCRSRWSPDH